MRVISWSPSFSRAYRRYIQRHPTDQERIEKTLRQLAENPFSPNLDTHKLKGVLSGLWACSAAYDCRIVFEFMRSENSEEEVLLLVDIGTHDDVY